MYTDCFNQTQSIVDFLFSDSCNYRENVCVGILNNAVMKELKYDISNINRISDLKYSKSCDYYITANTIKNNRNRKKSELFSLHNICIDIDMHNSNDDILKVADNLKYFLIEDFCERIPIPNVFSFTGRGIQLWWHFEEASSKLLFMYQALTQLLISELDKTIKAVETLSNLRIDKVASTNCVGYFRLPFTFNVKAEKFSTAFIMNKETYNLCDLFDEYCDKESLFSQSSQKQTTQLQQSQEYTSLIMKRKQFLEKYCENRNFDVVGSRDLVMFLYCVCLFQVMNVDFIMSSMKLLNNKFSEPLLQSQLDSIYNYMCKKKVLRFRQETFLSFLPTLTEEEKKSYLESRERNSTRYKKAELKKLEKENRDRKIKELYSAGITIYQISKDVCCSLSTVKRVLKSD